MSETDGHLLRSTGPLAAAWSLLGGGHMVRCALICMKSKGDPPDQKSLSAFTELTHQGPREMQTQARSGAAWGMRVDCCE